MSSYSYKSWPERLMESIKGVLVGLALFALFLALFRSLIRR